MKKFKILKPGTDEDVMGGPLNEGNPYVTTYGAPLPGEKLISQLEPWESTLVKYSLSGSTGTHKVLRVDDE